MYCAFAELGKFKHTLEKRAKTNIQLSCMKQGVSLLYQPDFHLSFSKRFTPCILEYFPDSVLRDNDFFPVCNLNKFSQVAVT